MSAGVVTGIFTLLGFALGWGMTMFLWRNAGMCRHKECRGVQGYIRGGGGPNKCTECGRGVYEVEGTGWYHVGIHTPADGNCMEGRS